MSGTYTVTATIGSCTFSDTVAVTVTGPATPTASSNSPVCSGTTLNLSTSAVSGATYSWTGPNGFMSSAQTPAITNVTTAAGGTYSVTVTVGGCTSIAGTVAVTVNGTPGTPNPTSDSPACIGTSLNLFAPTISGATYSWSGPNGFTSSSQNPTITSVVLASAGTYSLTISVAGCTSPVGTTSVTIVSPPAAPSPTSNSPLCVGGTLNLNTTSIAGATYSWTGPNGFTSSLLSPSISGITVAGSGTYSLTVTVGGCTSPVGTISVTVNPLPSTPTASSNSPVCAGNTLNLNTPAVATATYNWTGPNSFSSTSQTPSISSVTSLAAGTYSVTITVNGCTSAAGTTAVTINSLPTTPNPSSNTPVCVGTSLNLNTGAVSGATYSWTGPNGFTSSSQNPTIPNVTLADGGTYSVTVTVGGCTSVAGTEVVTVTSAPTTPTASSNTPVCVGDALQLNTAFVTGATYSWTGPNGFTSTSRTPTISNVTLAESGTYSVTITVGGCTSAAGTDVVSIITAPATPTASSNTPICEGSTLTLNTPFVSSATYSWTGPNGFTSTLRNPSITGATTAASGTYSVTITIGSCTSPAGTTTVVVNALPATPVITSNSPVCASSTLNLGTSAVSGATYSWIGPNGFTSSLQNPTVSSVTTAAAGVYSLTITVNGCASAVSTATVVVNARPATPTASSNTPVCTGTTLNLLTPTVAGATYSWTGPGSFSSSLQNPSRSPVTTIMSGTYSVTVTVNGCTSLPGSTLVSVRVTPATPSPSSNTPVCTGNPLNLTTPTVTSATYSWSGPNSFSSTTQNPTISNVTSAAAGTYSLTVNVLGCTSAVGTTSVTINSTPATPSPSSNSPVCTGNTLNLNTTTVTGATYSWTGPNSFASSSQNPTISNVTTAAAGSYSVRITVGGCASAPGITTVVVNATPATPTASNNSPLCEGSTLNLSTPSVTGATYSWTGPNGFTSTIRNPSVTNTALNDGGTYSVTVTSNGCTSAVGTTIVTINATPATPTPSSNSPVCIGNAVNLTVAAVTGATYSWTGPNSFASSQQNPIIPAATIAAGGTYSLVITVNGCVSAVGTTTVSMTATQATPQITTNSPACIGNSLTLNTPAVVGATYSWSGPNSFASTQQNPVITGVTSADAGIYSLTITVGGCSSSPATATVVVNPVPNTPTASNTSPVCSGSSFTVSTPIVSGATYSWTGPNGFTSSMRVPTITNSTAADAGTYSVTITVGGCTSAPATTIVTIDPTPAAPVITSNSPICIGNAIILNTASVAGASYNWTGPNSFSSTIQNPTIPTATSAAGGTYSLSITVGNCTSAIGTTTVVMTATQATPTVYSNSPICIGNTLNLTGDTIIGATYNWTGPNSFTSPLQSPSITNVTSADAGTYSLVVTVGGCSSLPGTTVVTVNTPLPAPTATGNSPVCIGGTLNLNTSTVTGAVYTWTGPNGYTSSLQNPSIANITTSDAGNYCVSVTVGGCTSPSGCINVSVNTAPTTPIISSNSPICIGDTLRFITPTVAGAVYNWNGPNGFTSTVQNPTIPNAQTAASGDYILTVTVGGCTSLPDTITVTINNPPTTPSVSSNAPVCSGDTLSLTTTTVAGATYNWTGPNGFTSNLQNPDRLNITSADAGLYSLTITIGTCTSQASSVAVSVDPSPDAPVVTPIDSTLCAGETLNLTTPAVAGAIYSWTGPDGFVSPLQNPTITAAPIDASGTYSLTITVNGCSSAPGVANITVDTVPAIPTVISNSPACIGGVLNLNTDTVLGATYNWTGPNGFIGLVQNPSITNITPAEAGTYSVIITLGGCVSDTGTGIVTVVAPPLAPTASSNSPLCSGSVLSLSTPTVAGATYNWSGPNGFTSPLQNPTIINATATEAGTYSVTITLGNCTSAAGTTAVVVNPLPTTPTLSSNSPICLGDTIQLSASTITGATYNWTGPNGFTSSLQNPIVLNATSSDSGTYYLTITANGCTSLADSTDVSVGVCTDSDGDGVVDASDIDDDNDGILDVTENLTAQNAGDTDNDGIPDRLDLDSDNDGIADVIEADGTDPDNDGQTGTGAIVDANSDGLADDLAPSGLAAVDSDNDGRPNFQDLDSDGDSINDLFESGRTQGDANNDGIVDGPDSDNDGLPDASDSDNGGSLTNPLWDSDGDGIPNYIDIDSDNDNLNDGENGEFPNLDCDADSLSNYLDPDPCLLVIPNGFSPDGDNINDLFVISGIDAYQGTKLKVMNRWGNLVYESTDYDNTWDGTANTNAIQFGDQKVPPGTYFYVIELTSGQTLPGTSEKTQTGFIEIRY